MTFSLERIALALLDGLRRVLGAVVVLAILLALLVGAALATVGPGRVARVATIAGLHILDERADSKPVPAPHEPLEPISDLNKMNRDLVNKMNRDIAKQQEKLMESFTQSSEEAARTKALLEDLLKHPPDQP